MLFSFFVNQSETYQYRDVFRNRLEADLSCRAHQQSTGEHERGTGASNIYDGFSAMQMYIVK